LVLQLLDPSGSYFQSKEPETIAPEISYSNIPGAAIEFPVASNATVAGRQFNRRVRVAISDSSGRMPAEQSTLSGATASPAR